MTKRAAAHLSHENEYVELIPRAAAGDARALDALLMKAQEVAYRFSYSVCGGPSDAEDVMQDALLKTFRHITRIHDPAAFRTWLYRTVRNACLMKRRRKVGQPERVISLDEVLPGADGPRDVGGGGLDPENLAVNAALRRRLDTALRALPPSHRAIVFLREMEGLSTKEVAQVLKMSESNVKMRLHRARLLLRKTLEA